MIVTLGAGLSWAVGNVVSRRARVTSGLSLVVWSALVVPVPALALSLALDGRATVTHTLARSAPDGDPEHGVHGLRRVTARATWSGTACSRRYPAGAVVPYVPAGPAGGHPHGLAGPGRATDRLEAVRVGP